MGDDEQSYSLWVQTRQNRNRGAMVDCGTWNGWKRKERRKKGKKWFDEVG